MKLYMVAGEASGDGRGAELMEALKSRVSDVEFYGAGGPRMRAIAGNHFQDWSDRAVVGIVDVIKNYGYFKKQFDGMLAEVSRLNPDGIVFIDYPGFNLRLAAAVKKKRLATRVIYYISPQVWAWHRGRIPKMARIIDLMICIFPFEKALYERSGLKTVFVGHPLLDSLAARRVASCREADLIGIFPGSRRKEIEKIFPVMIEAAQAMKRSHPKLRFEAAAISDAMAQVMSGTLQKRGLTETFCSIKSGDSHGLMQRATAGMVASGTATLEAAYFGLPFVILYRVGPITLLLGHLVVKVPFLGMVNILAGREIAREFLHSRMTPAPVAEEMLRLFEHEEAREQVCQDLSRVVGALGEGGAGARAAEAILAEMGVG